MAEMKILPYKGIYSINDEKVSKALLLCKIYAEGQSKLISFWSINRDENINIKE